MPRNGKKVLELILSTIMNHQIGNLGSKWQITLVNRVSSFLRFKSWRSLSLPNGGETMDAICKSLRYQSPVFPTIPMLYHSLLVSLRAFFYPLILEGGVWRLESSLPFFSCTLTMPPWTHTPSLQSPRRASSVMLMVKHWLSKESLSILP